MKKRILLVDDDPGFLRLSSAVLQKEGFETVQAKSGREALEQLAEETFDLILLDVMMPGEDGFDVCRRIKTDPGLEGIPVVFLTAKEEREAFGRGFDSGASMYIRKPVDAKLLRLVVLSMLERDAH